MSNFMIIRANFSVLFFSSLIRLFLHFAFLFLIIFFSLFFYTLLASDNQHIDNLCFESFGVFIYSNYLMCFFFVGLGGILFMILSFICALKMYFDKISPLILDKSYKSFPFCLKTF